MRLFHLDGCTLYLDARSSVVFWVNFSGIFQFSSKAVIRCASRLFGIVSSPFSSPDSIQFTTLFTLQYYLASLPWAAVALSRSSSPHFRLLILAVVLFHVVLQINSIFNVRSTSPNVCWDNKYKWFFFSGKSRREKMAFLRSPVRLTSRRPSSTPRVCTDGRSLFRPYADVLTKSSRLHGLPICITHGASLARFTLKLRYHLAKARRRKSLISTLDWLDYLFHDYIHMHWTIQQSKDWLLLNTFVALLNWWHFESSPFL